jgi:Flp pilus assembly protein CpaB
MKSKSIILIAVSLGFGLVAAIGISQVMGRNTAPPAPVKEKTLPVLVSADYMDARAEILEGAVTLEQWPESLVPPDAVSSLDQVKDKVLNCRVAKKMPILQQYLVNRRDVDVLPIPPGYKVVGIKLPADDLIAGLLNPGDTVDLIGVFNSEKTKVSRTFLTKVKVFSVNNRTTPDIERGKEQRGSQGGIVGVLLTKTQAEKLILAQKVAQIKLVLCSADADNGTQVAQENQADTTTDDFSDEVEKPVETPKFGGFEAMISKLVSGGGDEITHQMVMVTPDGPISFVFRKEAPLPQRIEGYTAPSSAKLALPAPNPQNLEDDTADFDDSADSPTDSLPPEIAGDSDSATKE